MVDERHRTIDRQAAPPIEHRRPLVAFKRQPMFVAPRLPTRRYRLSMIDALRSPDSRSSIVDVYWLRRASVGLTPSEPAPAVDEEHRSIDRQRAPPIEHRRPPVAFKRQSMFVAPRLPIRRYRLSMIDAVRSPDSRSSIVDVYWLRRASVGLTPSARRTGAQHENVPTTMSMRPTPARTHGSRGDTS
jgi:hypothetical protein